MNDSVAVVWMWIILQLLEPTITGDGYNLSINRLVAAVGRYTVLNRPTQVNLVSDSVVASE